MSGYRRRKCRGGQGCGAWGPRQVGFGAVAMGFLSFVKTGPGSGAVVEPVQIDQFDVGATGRGGAQFAGEAGAAEEEQPSLAAVLVGGQNAA